MAAWAYSDYVTLTDASAKRERLALHVQEVADRLANQSYSVEGLSVNPRENLSSYLDSLKAELAAIDSALGTDGTSSGARVWMASGRAVL